MEAVARAADLELESALASAAAGDHAAFRRIVAAYQEDLYGICVLVCRDRALADEALQSSWSIAWRKLGSVREPARLRPWLVSVAINEAKQLLRKRRRRTIFEVVADASDRPGGVDPATGVASMDLRAAIERLAPDDRALLAMRYVAGFNSNELSMALGISPSGIRNRLERLLRRLREELE
jgi:RNA polymerase sigma-70 factor (ECF subfamily)